ncbi:MAG: hypothetical protein KBS36_04510, partial [Bacteroidales bacterium]|nr:hypothetical protein [Candidatus Cryptobacteroides fimicaballi]
MANIKQRKELDLQKWPYDMTQLVLNIEDKKMVTSLKRGFPIEELRKVIGMLVSDGKHFPSLRARPA